MSKPKAKSYHAALHFASVATVMRLLSRLLPHRPAVRYTLVCFVLVLLAAFATHCRAESELWFEAGANVARAEAPVLGLALTFPDSGPTDTDYQVALHLIGAGDAERNQGSLSFMIVDGFGWFDIGFGICLLHHTDEISGSTVNFALSIAYRFRGGHKLSARHCSNAGMTPINDGRDLLLYGRRFR